MAYLKNSIIYLEYVDMDFIVRLEETLRLRLRMKTLFKPDLETIKKQLFQIKHYCKTVRNG